MPSTPSTLTSPSETASDLIRRVLSGEEIPLSELTEFLRASGETLVKEKKEKLAGAKDVDFF